MDTEGTQKKRGKVMAFAIMRCNKIKSMGAVSNSLKHCFRESETLNADPERTPTNEHLAASSKDEAMGKLRNLLPEKRRKDAIVAVEYVLTASPEWWIDADQEQRQSFFDSSMKWINEKYGPNNVITASIHKDELTPHLSVFVAPITKDGRLSAKELIGNKSQMVQDQTGYAKTVEHLGLERGIEGSKATHQKVKSHYAAIQKAIGHTPAIDIKELKPRKVKGVTVSEKIFGVKETEEGVVQRLNERLKNEISPIAAKASVSDQERERRKQIESIALELRKQNKAIQERFRGLSKAQIDKTFSLVSDFQKNNKIEKEKLKGMRKERDQGRDLGR